MFKHTDTIVKNHSAKVRKLESQSPERKWDYNLSEDQKKEVLEWRNTK